MKTYIIVGVILVAIVALLATNKKLVETLKNIFKIEELRSRILFTLGLLLIYRLGSFVTLPGVDHAVLESWTANFANDGSLMGLLNSVLCLTSQRLSSYSCLVSWYHTSVRCSARVKADVAE